MDKVNQYKKTFNYINSLHTDKDSIWLKQLYNFLYEKLWHAPGSMYNKHQGWEWWYFDHINNMLDMSITLYESFSKLSQLDFSLDNVIKVVLLHDLEKPFRYTNEGREYLEKNNIGWDDNRIRNFFIEKYNIRLNILEWNALKYIHWEGSDYSETERIMKPLAAFCHILDIASARIFYNQ